MAGSIWMTVARAVPQPASGTEVEPIVVAADPALGVTLAAQAPAPHYLLATILGFGGGHATLVLEDCARSPDAGRAERVLDTIAGGMRLTFLLAGVMIVCSMAIAFGRQVFARGGAGS